MALSGDTLAVGSPNEDSDSTGVNNGQNQGASQSGAAYVFRGSGSSWGTPDFIKASNTGSGDEFGWAVAIDVDTLVVAAPREASSATGLNGDETDNTAARSGAAYVFDRVGDSWSQTAYIKASNTEANDLFGGDFAVFGRPNAQTVALSGSRMLIGAAEEDSPATGFDGDQGNGMRSQIGAAYLFERDETGWSQVAYVKPLVSPADQGAVHFGESVALDGPFIVLGAGDESGGSSWPTADPAIGGAQGSGAVYVYSLP